MLNMSTREVRWQSSEVLCLVQWTSTFIFTFNTGNNNCRLFALLLYTFDKVYFIFNLVPSICYLVFYYSSRRFLFNSGSKSINSFFMVAHPISCGKSGSKSNSHPNERHLKNAPNKTTICISVISDTCAQC